MELTPPKSVQKRQKRGIAPADKHHAAQLERELFGDVEALESFGHELDAPADRAFAQPAERNLLGNAMLGNSAMVAFEDRQGTAGPFDNQAEQVAAGQPQPAATVIGQADTGAAPPPGGRRRPVWQDPDEEAAKVNVAARSKLRKLRQAEDESLLSGKEFQARLRQQHARLNPRTAWAALEGVRRQRKRRALADSSDEEDADEATEALLSSAGALLGRSRLLPPHQLEATRVKDANQHEPSRAVVQSVEWHPQEPLLLTAGLDKRLRLFQIDGVHNLKLASVYFEDMPIRKAAFAAGGSKVLLAGRRRHFYIYDVRRAAAERVHGLAGVQDRSLENFAASPSASLPLVAFLGSEGSIPLLSLRSRQAAGSLKMSGTARTAAFAANGLELLTAGSDGVVHTWDLRMRRCLARGLDEGCLNSTALAAAPAGGAFAAGSDSGVVNIYGHEQGAKAGYRAIAGLPKPAVATPPRHTLMNLTTTVDSLAWSPDGQALAMASRMKRDQLRIVHSATGTVFANWPTSRTPLGHVHSIAWSPRGGFIAVGNAKGRVLLYRLHHWGSL